MVNRDDILAVLRPIMDPEMPISIVDLGLVEHIDVTAANGDGAAVHIDILPTFVGCPALDMIRDDVEKAVRAVNGVTSVDVTFINDPPWTVDRISDEGREHLRAHGVTTPDRCGGGSTSGGGVATVKLQTSVVPCPFCGSKSTYLDSPFGPTRCRMIYYCEACRNSFEHMKRV